MRGKGSWGLCLLIAAGLAACASPRDIAAPAGERAAAAPAGDVCGALLAAGPDVPAIEIPGRPVRVAALGDFGEDPGRDLQPQRDVARAMVALDAREPFDLGITLGDNFYPNGLASVDSPRWKSQWEDLYGPLGIRFYATLGNHDYVDAPASLEAELGYTGRSATWCLPKSHYTFTAGPVQFFAVDTTPVESPKRAVHAPTPMAAQKEWLARELEKSRAPWKVVYAHHPIYTNGEHGSDHGKGLGVLPAVRDYLLPLLEQHEVDIYLAGHDHDLQALKPAGGVRFFISGGGGRYLRELEKDECREWAAAAHGFTVLEADAERMTVSFYGKTGDLLHETTWRKGERAEDCRR